MGFRSSGFYATVWEIREGMGNYLDVRLSTSKKDKSTGEYKTDWNGWARFVGEARDAVEGLPERARIRITEFDVTNSYSKEKQVTYTNYVVFKVEDVSEKRDSKPAAPGRQSNSAKAVDEFINVPDGIDEEGLPFD